MPDNNFSADQDKKIEKKPPATVGLRSDVFASSPEASTADAKNKDKFVWAKLTDRQKISILGITVFILLFIGAGVYAVVRNGEGVTEPIEEDKQFGELPENEEQAEKIKQEVSGLSGMPCETFDRRPIGVMLSSDPITRPVSGFAKADMIWELPALVSNVTRLLAVYQCGQPAEIGSVRSVRHDYLFLAEGVDAIIGHWGGSYHALNRVRVGEFQTINALTNPHNAYYRKSGIRAPYNGFTAYDRLWNALTKLGYRTTTDFEGYDFKDDAPRGDRPTGGRLSIAWPGQYRVHYEYNPETNRYHRFWGGVAQVDGEDGAAVAPSAVIIMRAVNRSAPGPGGYNDVGVEGSGEMSVYQDGQVITGTWRKSSIDKRDPVHFLDAEGNPITLTRGQVWVMAVDPSISVTWEAKEGL